jgi:hypothetical protein
MSTITDGSSARRPEARHAAPAVSQCWICRTHVGGLEPAIVIPLLLHLDSRDKVRGCCGQCEELRTSSAVILAHFYRLECGHYCASHIDHRCCLCRTKEAIDDAGMRSLVTVR